MSNDNPDKTVFRQSAGGDGARGDSTIIRPSPGRRGAQTQMPRSDHAPPQSQVSPPYTARAAGGDLNSLNSAQFKTFHGLNPLVNAASMLIAVYHKTRGSASHPNVAALHQQLVSAIKSFEVTAKEKDIRPEIVLVARYILCAALDEAVLNTPWGADSAWTQRSLLSTFHNETNGGEKFFILVDRMRERPAENLEILELMYILLSLGFEGKYRVINRGREMIESIRDELYQIIRRHRGEFERDLSGTWRGLGRMQNSLINYVPMWVVASIVCAVLVVSYSGFRYWLYQSTDHVATQLEIVAATEPGKTPVIRP